MAPDLIALGDSGIAALRAGETADPVVFDAAASCPMGAISVVELESATRAA